MSRVNKALTVFEALTMISMHHYCLNKKAKLIEIEPLQKNDNCNRQNPTFQVPLTDRYSFGFEN